MTGAPLIASPDRRRFMQRLAASCAGLFAFGVAKSADASTTGINPYLGQIMLVPFTFPPKGWAFCNGQLLPIAQYQALFSILGTTYGGNGQTNFALPDLRDRVPMHAGSSAGPGLTQRVLGEKAGEANHTLIVTELPAHTHVARAAAAVATIVDPAGMYPAFNAANSPQYATSANSAMSDVAISSLGGNQPHPNSQPSLTLNFVIALQGVFPSRS